jgi:hypothetical protein
LADNLLGRIAGDVMHYAKFILAVIGFKNP